MEVTRKSILTQQKDKRYFDKSYSLMEQAALEIISATEGNQTEAAETVGQRQKRGRFLILDQKLN